MHWTDRRDFGVETINARQLTRLNTRPRGSTSFLAIASIAVGFLALTVPLPSLDSGAITIDNAAWAKNGGGNGGGGGNGNGGGNGAGGNGSGNGGGGGGNGKSAKSGSTVDGGQPHKGSKTVGKADAERTPQGLANAGKAVQRGWEKTRAALDEALLDLGLAQEPKGKTTARGRYSKAMGLSPSADDAPAKNEFGDEAETLDSELSGKLAGKGWGSQKKAEAQATGFKNHGQRVRTMVELAKTLGYGAHVGALQANFGANTEDPADDAATAEQRTALETELTTAREAFQALDDSTSPEAEELADKIAELERDLADLDTPADTESEWDGDWRTADLDVNDDGVVDYADLDLARQQAASQQTSSGGTGDATEVDGEAATDDGEVAQGDGSESDPTNGA